jgi:lysophospholipid acyltransferase (LPLAT)-like uncharacterized protein
MIVPLPFSKALFLYGTPFVIPRDEDAEAWRMKLADILNALADEAERLVNE